MAALRAWRVGRRADRLGDAAARSRAASCGGWGCAPGAAGRRAAGALTEREREIAALAASGATNPEIAREVFLSRKTVERHVSAALAKLGARNRTELASRLAELEGAREAAGPGEGPPP